MDIVKEISKLPQYEYEWSNGHAILGADLSGDGETGSKDIILGIWQELKAYYEKDGVDKTLSDDEKIAYAKAVKRMEVYCKGNITKPDKLISTLNALSDEDKKENEWQVDMYQRGRKYFEDYNVGN